MNGIFFEGRAEDNYLGHILAEIYKDRVYAPFLDGKEGLTIIDIGANIGLTTNYFSQFASKVYSLEPSKEHFSCLTKMVEFNNLENVVPLNMALYMEDGTFSFGHNKNRTMFSLHMATWDKDLEMEQVRAVTFETLFKEQNIKKVDFIKLDIEGSEHEVLGGESFGKVADKIDSMLVEVHAWSGRHPNQVNESLKNRGFKIQQIPNDATLIYAYK
jgi:FkbM family methyltransferase